MLSAIWFVVYLSGHVVTSVGPFPDEAACMQVKEGFDAEGDKGDITCACEVRFVQPVIGTVEPEEL